MYENRIYEIVSDPGTLALAALGASSRCSGSAARNNPV